MASLIAPPRSSSFSHNSHFSEDKWSWKITKGWIPNKVDSGFQFLDSGFHELDSGFQSPGFRIPQAKIAWIPDSGLPYMGRIVLLTIKRENQTTHQVSCELFLIMVTFLPAYHQATDHLEGFSSVFPAVSRIVP